MTPSERALLYAERVVDGEIPAGRYVLLACKRFIKDLQRKRFRYRYDAARADDAVHFIEKLPHTKGRWARERQLLNLSDFQIFIVCNICGWLDKKTGFRRFREAYIEIPRKNGKSILAAAIGLYLFCADLEYGAEVYSGATTEKQAWEVFRPAKQMVERTEALREAFGIEVHAKTMSIAEDGSRFEPVIGDPGDGPSPSCAIIDEFHEHKKANLSETMSTGMAARDQPLMFYITTAGTDMGGPCYEKRLDVIKVLDGSVKDETVFGIIFCLDEDDRWDSEEAIIKANPNLGVSVSKEYLLTEMHKARRSSRKQNSFRTKHLNQWVGAKVAWMNMLRLHRCKARELKLEDFKGQPCVIGLDFASKIDVASMCILFRNGNDYAAFWKRYVPHEAVYGDEPLDERYKAWAEAGHLITTPGNVIDFGYIEDDLLELRDSFDIRQVGYDPWQATQFATRMEEEGFLMVEVPQTVKQFSEPMKDIEAKVIDRQFAYDGDPVATWMFGNVVALEDKKQNIFPNKEVKRNKIDDIVSLIIAWSRLMLGDGEGGGIDEGFLEL